MKRHILRTLLVLIGVSAWAGSRDAQWKKVAEAVSQGLPRTAITNLEPIIQGALHDKAYAEAVKAIGRKVVLEGQIQGSRPEEKISRLEAWTATGIPEIVPVLDTLLAHWYWQYFQQNRWRFLQRSVVSTPSSEGVATWDVARLFGEIDRRFQSALAAGKVLKLIPISDWDDLLERGNVSDAHQPTLYDFVAHEALAFYTSDEEATARPEDPFEPSADSQVFAAAERFVSWDVTRNSHAGLHTADDSPILRALRLYQDLLRFHRDDPKPRLAFAGVDLERLSWAWKTSFGDDKNARYKAALERFIRTYRGLEITAEALEREARVLQQEGDLISAHGLAQRGAQTSPRGPGTALCSNLVFEIEAKSMDLSTERIWNCSSGEENPGGPRACPTIDLRYRNVGVAHFRAIPYDWELVVGQNGVRNLDRKERAEILTRTPALRWSRTLLATNNYQELSTSFPAPEGLKPGFYLIAATDEPSFSRADSEVSIASVWVSDLACVTRNRHGRVEGFVLDARSGEPLKGAEISTWESALLEWSRLPNLLTTDEQGFFSFSPSLQQWYRLRARYRGQEVAPDDIFQSFEWQRQTNLGARAQTVFFTDRSSYRPAQTIQYKGICLLSQEVTNDYRVLQGENLAVVFKDVNGNEVARHQHRASDFGSFTGSFTAPRDRLMGQMSIQAEGRAEGTIAFRVEEYKRPKFEVAVEAPKSPVRLEQVVALTGRAVSYTGSPVIHATVRYRIDRQGASAQQIAHGFTTTDGSGSFKIRFVAQRDPKVATSGGSRFFFVVQAEVTDSTGETRWAQRGIWIGYTTLEASLNADEWQTEDKPVEVKVTTRTLEGEPQVAKGTARIYELRPPERVHRSPLPEYRPTRGDVDSLDQQEGQSHNDLSDPNNWSVGKVMGEHAFVTDTNGMATLSFQLPVGAYRTVMETHDRFGRMVTDRLLVQVLRPSATNLAIKIPYLLAAPSWEVEPGQDFMALWGTGYQRGRAFVEIECRHEILQRYWTEPGQTQQQIRFPVTEAMRGGFTLHVTQVRENRAYLESRRIEVPWNNKHLDLKWERVSPTASPGGNETWTLQVTDPTRSGGQVPHGQAEMVATLYDESLDTFMPHHWREKFSVFRFEASPEPASFGNAYRWGESLSDVSARPNAALGIRYRSFPADLTTNFWGNDGQFMGGGGGFGGGFSYARRPVREYPGSEAALGIFSARKNLSETAFFFPQLMSDSNGIVRMTFTMPEALTKWRFMGFAHDRSLRSGYLEGHTVTAKDLMVQPNPPRFLREGDTVDFTVKVSNQSDKPQAGTVALTFSDASASEAGGASAGRNISPSTIDKLLANTKPEQPFDIPAKQTRSFSWRISVPDGCGFLTYKAVAATATLSDGEEGAVPVLSRRILVTESLPLPIRGPATKEFQFTKLLKSGSSKTLQNQSLTVQMVSNPAWYAVLALPYLMEYPYECTEQTFNRLYANSLARTIANSDPKIRRIFDQWKNTPALDSPLEKNQDLKSVMLEETPWLRQAQTESQARRNVGILFDGNRLDYETEATLRKLTEQQLADGSWPWFPGGRGNDYITLYITTGFGRLRHLGADINVAPAIKSLQRLDGWMTEHYEAIQKGSHPELYVPSSTDALYLYGRSFFLKDLPIGAPNKVAIEFFLNQSREFWLKTDCRQTQGHLAIALRRFAEFVQAKDPTPEAIMKSIKERSVSNEEMGMFWRDTELSWWWYRAPIETQALMIEAFDEVMHDQAAVEECRVWLLKQKQTQDWKTTKATADAVYALLLRGKDILSSDALVELRLDGVDLTPKRGTVQSPQSTVHSPQSTPESIRGAVHSQSQAEPGTGFYEVRFVRGEIKPKLGEITVKKTDLGVAWGSVTWQYLEDMTKVTPYEGTPLKLKKSLFLKTTTKRGPVLEVVKGPLQPGDELVVRLELRVDRDMEYVHLKDQRGSGTEPVNVLSQFKYQDGLAYYESTRDTASHFFIDYLPKGVYVFEYSTRVQLRGQYQTGVAEIQCMYAPEFNSHSESLAVVVR